MTRAKAFWICAVVANVLGWVLPVVDDYRGVHAFRVALSPLWPYEEFHIPPGYVVWLSVASALTNVVFVAFAAYLWPRVRARSVAASPSSRSGRPRCSNLHWTFTMQDSAKDLAIGYYVWVLSFVLLLLAAHPALSPRNRPPRR